MQNRISTVLWLVLLILTGVSFLLGEASHPGPVAVALIGLITFTKGKLVIDHFMGLRHVGGLFFWIVSGWLTLVIGLIGLAYRL